MSLTRIQRGMIADGAVIVPSNLSATGTTGTNSFLRGDATWANTLTTLTVDSVARVGQIQITTATTGNGLDMNNTNIVGVNLLQFNDPGPGEGIGWYGPNWWKVFDSPNDLTTNTTGNLQFVSSGTRRLTVGIDGKIDVPGNLIVGGTTTSTNIQATNATITNATVGTLTATNFSISNISVANLNATNITATNITSTASTVSRLSATSAIITNLTATNITATNFTATSLTVNGSVKLKGLSSSTATYILYYDDTTGAITYQINGGGGGTINPFDQDLNTTDQVTFKNLTLTDTTTNAIFFPYGSIASQITGNRIDHPDAISVQAGTGTIVSVSGTKITLQAGGNTWNFDDTAGQLDLPGTLKFSDNTKQTTAFQGDQKLFTTSTVTFNTITATNATVGNFIATTFTVSTVTSNSTLTLATSTSTFPIKVNADLIVGGGFDILAASSSTSILGRADKPFQEVNADNGYFQYGVNSDAIVPWEVANTWASAKGKIGNTQQRWKELWVKTIYTSNATINFENTETNTTSTLSLTDATLHIDGLPVVDQNVSTDASPVFSSLTATTSLTIADYTMPTAIASTSGYAMVAGPAGQIEFQPAIMTGNISIDGGFANSTFTAYEFAIDGGGA